jgi:transposase-like protein
MAKKQRRKFKREQKDAAVQDIVTGRKTKAQVREELDIVPSVLERWLAKAKDKAQAPTAASPEAESPPTTKTTGRKKKRGVRYPQKFRYDAARRVEAGEKGNAVAKDLGVSDATIYNWHEQLKAGALRDPAEQDASAPGNGNGHASGKVNGHPIVVRRPVKRQVVNVSSLSTDDEHVLGGIIFLNEAADQLDGVRPADLNPFQLNVLQARAYLTRRR